MEYLYIYDIYTYTHVNEEFSKKWSQVKIIGLDSPQTIKIHQYEVSNPAESLCILSAIVTDVGISNIRDSVHYINEYLNLNNWIKQWLLAEFPHSNTKTRFP